MYFGELALLRGEARAATVLAAGDCDLLALERAEFMRVLGPLAAQLEQQASRYASVASAKQARGAGASAGRLCAGAERGPARLRRHSTVPWHSLLPVSVPRASFNLACRSLMTWPRSASGVTTTEGSRACWGAGHPPGRPAARGSAGRGRLRPGEHALLSPGPGAQAGACTSSPAASHLS
jgi:hypothetical protein